MATFELGSLGSSLLEVREGTGTLEQLYQDFYTAAGNAETYMSKTGSDPYTYSIHGNRELELESGVTLNITNTGDTLQWDSRTGSDSPVIDHQRGAVLNIGEGVTIDFDTSITRTWYSISYFEGTTNFQGTSSNPITLKNLFSLYIYNREGELHTWDYVNIEDGSYSTYNGLLQLYYTNNSQNENSFTNIYISETISPTTSSARGLGLAIYGDWSKTTLNNITIDGTYYGAKFEGAICKLSNLTIKNTYGDPIYDTYNCGWLPKWYYNPDIANEDSMFYNSFNQPKVTFDNCTFQDNKQSGGNYQFYYSKASIIKLKDCTFSYTLGGVSGRGISSYYGTKCLLEGTQTYNNISIDRYWYYNGSIHWTKTLDLTVEDVSGNPIEGASITIQQSQGYERETLYSDSNGEVLDVFGDLPVFVEKIEVNFRIFYSVFKPLEPEHPAETYIFYHERPNYRTYI